MPLKLLLRQNKEFFIPVLIFLIAGIIFLAFYPKELIHLTFNSIHHPFLDTFFKYSTHLGDGLIFVVFIVILIFVRWRFSVGLVYSALLTLFLTGFLKQVVFEGEPRPVKYFENKKELRLVDGVEVHMANSFPSGHTTTAFACFGFLALISRRRWVKFSCALAAMVVGYSRIYLSQHFLADVAAGSALGVTIAILGYYMMNWINWPPEDARLRLSS